ncbi:MAG TPA: hypothetical protein VGE12_05285 [Noviherbaspirillum sp.]
MTDRQEWNRCRYVRGSREGHYESWFQRANHPDRPLAFWIRYTIFSPKDRPDEAVGELWAIYFDGEKHRIAAVKKALPISACAFTQGDRDFHFRVGAAILTQDRLEGRVTTEKHALQWQLRYEGGQEPMLLLPHKFYDGGFPKAKALVGMPNAIFSGEFTVDGVPVSIDRWQGSQNHNWGSRHTDSYAWGQVAGFDNAPEAFLECSTARLKLGPFWTPPMSLVVLRIDGREIALNGILRALRAKSQFDFFDWRIESQTEDVRIALRVHAPRDAFVGLVYDNPPGGMKTCLNSKLATCELTLEEPGKPARMLIARDRAAFEILTDRDDHGVAVVA